MIPFYVWYPYTELSISIIAMCSSVLVIYMAIFRTTNKGAKGYSHMLFMNASVDLAFSCATFFFRPSLYFANGLFFMTVSNPYLPYSVALAMANMFLQAFLAFLSVVMLPIQFYHRYRIICNRSMTTAQLAKIFLLVMIFPLLHALNAIRCSSGPQPHKTQILTEDPTLPDPRSIPVHIIIDTTELKSMIQAMNCMFISVGSYIAITIIYRKTMRVFVDYEADLSTATKRIQRQMERVIFIQAVFPVFALFVPAMMIPIIMLLNLNNRYVGCVMSFAMHSTPLCNSVSVLICVPHYRRIICRGFGFHMETSAVNTTSKGTSQPPSRWNSVFTVQPEN